MHENFLVGRMKTSGSPVGRSADFESVRLRTSAGGGRRISHQRVMREAILYSVNKDSSDFFHTSVIAAHWQVTPIRV